PLIVENHKDSHLFYEILDILINSMFFLLFGYFLNISYQFIILSVVLILLKRLPIFLLLPLFRNKRERFFIGWYGPIGVGALFFFSHFKHELLEHIDHLKIEYKSINSKFINDFIKHTSECLTNCEKFVNTAILCSVLLHGTTAVIIHLTLRRKNKAEELLYVSESEVEESGVY
ncbi:Monovalent Cation:Proton Antiporter-1 (CPA1) Family, partial [Pseudoloma neurophilia]